MISLAGYKDEQIWESSSCNCILATFAREAKEDES